MSESAAPTLSTAWRTFWRIVIGVVAFVAFVVIPLIWWRGRPVTEAAAPTDPGRLVYADDFERTEVGGDYRQSEPDPGWPAGQWQVRDGRLYGEKIHNAGLWLVKPLPEKVRVEFDARAETKTGDLKCEIFGDGRTHQSGYIAIFGGWNNTINCIARRDEHGEDRKEDRRTRVVPNVDYKWTLIRIEDTIEWYVDGQLFLKYHDAHPVRGHHFAFNNWEALTSFDNLRIYDLSDRVD